MNQSGYVQHRAAIPGAALGLVLAGLAGLAASVAVLPARLPAQSVAEPAASPLVPAPGARVVTLTAPGYFNEPSIAIDPRNPRRVVAAYQVTASAAYSEDAGATWTLAKGVAPAQYRVSGDVSVTFDKRGHTIVCFIAFDKLGTAEYWAHGATRNGIFVRRSIDGGKNWEPTFVAVDSVPTATGIPFEDKPYIIADNTDSKFAGNLYIGWTEFTLDKSVMLLSRSTDGGATWSKPIRISTQSGLPRDDNGDLEGFSGAVAADGTLSVVWSDGDHLVFTSSHDGGKTFAPSRPIITTGPSYFNLTHVARSNGFPQMAIDPRNGKLFVTWSDYRNGDVDVFSATSTDAGATWSDAVRVNDDPVHNGSDQFFQWLAVDPSDGSANVVFYDRRADSTNRASQIVLARSTDGGRTFRNYAWTTTPSDADGDFIGDYTGIAALNGRVYGVWAEEAAEAAKAPDTSAHGGSTQPSSTAGKHRTVVKVGVADFAKRP